MAKQMLGGKTCQVKSRIRWHPDLDQVAHLDEEEVQVDHLEDMPSDQEENREEAPG